MFAGGLESELSCNFDELVSECCSTAQVQHSQRCKKTRVQHLLLFDVIGSIETGTTPSSAKVLWRRVESRAGKLCSSSGLVYTDCRKENAEVY